jgi:hypothetical protein
MSQANINKRMSLEMAETTISSLRKPVADARKREWEKQEIARRID